MREERALISVHEAGHAVVALLLGYRVVYVSLAGGGGHTRYRAGDRRVAVAMIYPEAQKNTGRRRAKDENALKIKAIPVNSGLLSQARTVLRHSREQ